ncbi:MAG: DUF2225 domain-containing protein [bacterium]
MELPNTEAMSVEEKIWFARAIAGMIVADGRVDDSELEFLKEAISFLEDRDQVNGIMAVVRQGKTPSLEARKIDPKQSFIILKYLAELMVVDGKMSETEITFFVYAGGLLGFTSNILTKLWKTARSMLEATKPLAKISAGKNASLVRLTSLSESRCTFRNPRAMVPNMPVYIQISKSGSEEEFYDRVEGRVTGQRHEKWDEKSVSIRVDIVQRLGDQHGILQILFPDRYEVTTVNDRLTPKKSSLTGRIVNCFACGNDKVHFWSLRARSMITKQNIFGIPKYLSPSGSMDFCDFNLLDVTSCTSCGFSTNILENFRSQSNRNAPFNVEQFQEGWEERMQSSLEKIKDPAAFMSEERDLEMALLSYDLAIETHKRLSEVADTPYANVRKMASLNMVKAEMLSEAGRIDEAKAALKKVIEWLEPIFEQLDKEEIIKACLLLFRLKVYFKDFQGAGGLMKFMDNYDTEGKLNQESEEFKVLSVSQQALKKCYDDREEYSEDKLKTFHLPE